MLRPLRGVVAYIEALFPHSTIGIIEWQSLVQATRMQSGQDLRQMDSTHMNDLTSNVVFLGGDIRQLH